MSIEQEQIVRDFLGPRWSRMPYDWMDALGDDGLSDMCLHPIPDEVFDAYEATRNNDEDRNRDEGQYGQYQSHEGRRCERLGERPVQSLSVVPPLPDHYAKLTAAERKAYDAHWDRLQELVRELH